MSWLSCIACCELLSEETRSLDVSRYLLVFRLLLACYLLVTCLLLACVSCCSQSRIEGETLQALELNAELERLKKVTADHTANLEASLGASLGSQGLTNPTKLPFSEVHIQEAKKREQQTRSTLFKVHLVV